MGPHPKDLFGPEPTFTEVEKQWEEAAPDTTSGGEWITISLLAIIVALVAVQTYKVLDK